MRPHNLPFVLLGAGLLWFGWFGFNAGTALAANGTAALAFINTQIATAAAAWRLDPGGAVPRRQAHHPGGRLGRRRRAGRDHARLRVRRALGGDPARPGGRCASAAYAIGLKHKLGYDDSLDVVGVHLVGGAFGAVSLGFLAAYPLLAGQRKGLFYGGGVAQLGVQVLGPVAVGLYSFTVAWILGKIIDKTMGFRVSEEDEATGVDLTQHAETAYDFGSHPPRPHPWPRRDGRGPGSDGPRIGTGHRDPLTPARSSRVPLGPSVPRGTREG